METFKKGDRVRIKSWEQMVDEYDLIKDDSYITLPVSCFVNDMKPLCGELATITSISSDGYVELKFANEDNLDTKWQYSTYMLEKVEYAINDIIVTQKYGTYVKGIWKVEEEKDMNKVLELYAKRKSEEIDKKYKEKVEKDYNELELVKQYKEIIKDFEIEMDELYNSALNISESIIHQRYTSSDYKYALNCDIKNNIEDIYSEEHNKEIKAINDLVEEVEAQLSLSGDLDYQREILIKYNIIDKKTGKIK